MHYQGRGPKGSFRCTHPSCQWALEGTSQAAYEHVKSHHAGMKGSIRPVEGRSNTRKPKDGDEPECIIMRMGERKFVCTFPGCDWVRECPRENAYRHGHECHSGMRVSVQRPDHKKVRRTPTQLEADRRYREAKKVSKKGGLASSHVVSYIYIHVYSYSPPYAFMPYVDGI